jgi:geranylgeranyl reductase family protein
MQYDVAIVGAGPAGATAAKFLAEQGIRTIVIDKAWFPRDKPCGGGLQLRILLRFKYIQEHDLIDSYSSELHIHTASMNHHLDFSSSQHLQAMVRRTVFDEGLVKIATRCGAVLQEGRAAQAITKEKENIRIVLTDGTTVDTRLVIGADGIWSTIAKNIGMKTDCTRIGVCVFHEYSLDSRTMTRLYGDQRAVHLHLQPCGLAGYGWVFPKKEHVNIGIAEFRQAINPSSGKKNLHALYRRYLQILKHQHLIPTNLPTTSVRGGVFPTCPMKQLNVDRVLLCGDAGGLVNPMTGEGIFYAMSSGEMAAKVAIQALENDATDARSLRQYQRGWNREFHTNFALLSRISKHWAGNLEGIIEVASKDEKLLNIACAAIPSPGGIHQEKWKLARRLLITYCKHRLRMK